MSLNIDYGTTGVKRQSLRKGTPRNFVANLLEKGASDEDILERIEAAILKDADYRRAVSEYWLAGERRNLTRPPRIAPTREAAVEVRKAQDVVVNDFAAVMKTRAEKIVLLEMLMPNGKRLANCTFKEVANFGGKFVALSKGGKPSEKVGKLSETAVRKLFR